MSKIKGLREVLFILLKIVSEKHFSWKTYFYTIASRPSSSSHSAASSKSPGGGTGGGNLTPEEALEALQALTRLASDRGSRHRRRRRLQQYSGGCKTVKNSKK